MKEARNRLAHAYEAEAAASIGNIIVEKMELASIHLAEEKAKPTISSINEADGFFLSRGHGNDFWLRGDVYARLKRAQKHLPQGVRFIVFEAYRPQARQIELWNKVLLEMKSKHPLLSKGELQALCETCIANPYDGIGSGHQAGCAIDIALCDSGRRLFDMGTRIGIFNEWTRTQAAGLSGEVQYNRALLKDALEAEGFINYPAEWWHFSYGDHQWAWLTGRRQALYGALDLPATQPLETIP